MSKRLPKRHVWACDCQGWSRDDRCEALDAEVRDLKARLKAARSVSVAMQERAPAVLLKHVTDLRVKHWRKP